MNGAVEVANKNVKNILKKMTSTYKDWHDLLPFTLCTYCIVDTSFCTPYDLRSRSPMMISLGRSKTGLGPS